MMYEAVIPIHVALSDPAADLGAAIDDVTDQLALLDERTPGLLDYAVSSDAADNGVVFELTVEADDDLQVSLTRLASRDAVTTWSRATPMRFGHHLSAQTGTAGC